MPVHDSFVKFVRKNYRLCLGVRRAGTLSLIGNRGRAASHSASEFNRLAQASNFLGLSRLSAERISKHNGNLNHMNWEGLFGAL